MNFLQTVQSRCFNKFPKYIPPRSTKDINGLRLHHTCKLTGQAAGFTGPDRRNKTPG